MKRVNISIDRERCKECGYCVMVCPKKVLSFSSAINGKGYHYAEAVTPENCIGCAMCATMCPEAAIELWEES